MISADAIRGYVDIMVLSTLKERPSYAYEIAKTIAEVSEGQYVMKQTTLYSAVKRLEGAGHVASFPSTSESGKTRTYYELTRAGLETLTAKCIEWEATKTVVDRFVKGMKS